MEYFEDEGYCELMIKGKNLDVAEIKSKVGIGSTKENGIVFSVTDVQANSDSENDLISFKINMNEGESPNDTINSLAEYLLLRDCNLFELKKTCDVHLRWYLKSIYAELDCIIKPDTLKKIANLGIKFDVSIFSYGGVDDE